MVTSLLDGINRAARELVAARDDSGGLIILGG
jgi:trehalose-6-phosphate synthase